MDYVGEMANTKKEFYESEADRGAVSKDVETPSQYSPIPFPPRLKYPIFLLCLWFDEFTHAFNFF